MSKAELTADQRAVVEHSSGALLVSAAAGSGKTKVLVDRLLKKVCDPQSSCNIDDFLIITFTNAAAAELRLKIAKEIRQRLAENGANRHLQKQLTRIYQAEISTVHAFCSKLLRDYAHQLDIPADFRVAEETECEILKEKALEATLKELYASAEKNENLQALLRTLGYARDDRRLGDLILTAYENIQCHANPHKWVAQCRDHLTPGRFERISETPWGAHLLSNLEEALEHHIQQMTLAVQMIAAEPALARYLDTFSSNLGLLQRMKDRFSWDDLAAMGKIDFGRLPPIPNCSAPELQEKVKQIRTHCKDDLTKRMKRFSADEGETLKDLESTYPALQGLLDASECFMKAFRNLKLRRHVLDFSDLEHETICLLVDRYTEQPTKIAQEISGRFAEILVDEYQDTNEVQDTIFRAISKNGNNLFMVGDVKQSIYRFRLADPGIFLDKYLRFTRRENDNSDSPRKILLSVNFRSRPEIIEAVNHVFRTVMSPKVGEITYGSDEELHTIRDFAPMQAPATELHLIEVDRENEELELGRKEEVEARFVAGQIQKLLDGTHYVTEGDSVRPMRPSDIAILMRSLSSTAAIFTRALAKIGIPVSSNRAENIFDSTEVATLLAYLQIVDNPHQDVPLITALSSPVGNFSADDLAMIRSANRNIDFYDALCAAAKTDEKCKKFLEDLADLRQQRKWLDLTSFLDYLVLKTDMLNVFSVMKDGARRTANLQSFLRLGSEVSSLGITTLSEFLRHVAALRERGYGSGSEKDQGEGVKIMSIHKSKGLEFPVVFLCDLSRRFNFESAQQAVLTDTELMIGSNVFDKKHMIQYPSIAKLAIASKMRREMISEELRVLYVAMTRAKERLIMTYCGANLQTKVQHVAENAGIPLSPYIAGEVSCPGDWVLYSAAIRPEAMHIFGGAPRMEAGSQYPWKIVYHEAVYGAVEPVHFQDAVTDDSAKNDLTCLSRQQGDHAGSDIPAKLTATQLKGRSLDDEVAEFSAERVSNEKINIPYRPRKTDARKLTGAQKGTATHLFMQYCVYGANCDKHWLEEEKTRLLKYAFLSPEQIDAVEDEKVLQFFESDLGRLLTQAENVEREFKFSILTDASDYFTTSSEGKVMLQGVVDCIIFTDDGMIVLDYKTDRIGPEQERARTEYYRPQLDAYSSALQKIFRQPVLKKIVYYFETGSFCEL